MVHFRLSYKMMAGFLAIIIFVSWIGYYAQQVESNTRGKITEQARIVAESERAAKYNLELYAIAESYVLHDSELERSRARSRFSDSYSKLRAEIQILKETDIDQYTLSMVEKYAHETELNFEKITELQDAKILSNDSAEIAELESQESIALKSIEDNEFKVIGARNMIVETAKQNMNDAIAEAGEHERTFGMMLSAVFIFSVALSLFITHTLTKRIAYLRECARLVGKGNLNIKLDISSGDELGEVAAAFNKMTEDLKKSTVSLREMDEIVRERTSETEAKNEELERFNKLSVGRELKMIELKKRIAELEETLSKKSLRQRTSSS